MRNVVERLRSGEAPTEKERRIHEVAACGVLRDLHDERVEEEKRGLVRWLRPDYQVPRFGDKVEGDLTLDVLPDEDDDQLPDAAEWPAQMHQQVKRYHLKALRRVAVKGFDPHPACVRYPTQRG